MDWSNPESVGELVERLLNEGSEKSWIEFKENNDNPEKIGEYISSLSNSAALEGQEAGYLVFGVHDGTLEPVGTVVNLDNKKVGNQDLRIWLTQRISPSVFIERGPGTLHGFSLFAVRIDAARQAPTNFRGKEYIRVGPHTKPLGKHPEIEQRLWRSLEYTAFEVRTAKSNLNFSTAMSLIDLDAYYELERVSRPQNHEAVRDGLVSAGVVKSSMDDQWQITNFGSLLYAKRLSDFGRLERKSIRVIQYEGTSRVRARQEKEFRGGYAVSFLEVLEYISALLPASEVIEKNGLRMDGHLFPMLAIRELVANAVIHQDLSAVGQGPMVEIFDDRIEISNPGIPLLDPMRFIDGAPRSRNERLARAMRLHGFCEERGSGWDKVAFEVEFHQLPSPEVSVDNKTTKVVLFAPKPLRDMDKMEKIRATYQHACLNYVSNNPTNNESVRQRFGMNKNQSPQASKIIRDSLDEGAIVAYDPTVGVKSLRYVPFWAGAQGSAVSESLNE